jgi:recombination associated protein RdgC
MFKNAIIFRIDADWVQPEAAAIEEALGLARFTPCGATQRESFGWVEPRGEKHGPLAEFVGGQLMLKLCFETKMLPASVVKDKVDEKVEKLKEERGLKRVGAAVKREIKQEVELELLPKAFTKKGATMMWVNARDKFLVVGAGSLKKADRLVDAFVEAMSQVGSTIKLTPVHTQTSPAVAMSEWLTTQEAPAGFSVDRDCELKSTDGEKSTVRYSRHTLDIKEVVEHIQVQGKTPTKLSMTHDGRFSFVLADDMSLKKLELLDVVLKEGGEGKDSGFDADVAIFTGEMSKLIPALIEALGGEAILGEEGADTESESGDAGAGEVPNAAAESSEEASTEEAVA